MTPFLFALMAHGVIGLLDVVFNHELIARLPQQAGAAPEERLHSARELVFAVIFFGMAWFAWHGVAALAIAALFLAEIVISTVDTVLELDTRLLPVTERVAHVALFVNLGIMIGLIGPVLFAWLQLPKALVAVDHGWISWALSVMSVGAFGWSIRDALSARKGSKRTMRPETHDIARNA